MKETKSLWSIWSKSVQWDKKTAKQKLISAWFSLSFIVLGVSGSSFIFSIIAAVNFGCAAYFTAKYVPVNEED